MTWAELAIAIKCLPLKQMQEKAVVFDYSRNRFADLQPCYDGVPEFHLTVFVGVHPHNWRKLPKEE